MQPSSAQGPLNPGVGAILHRYVAAPTCIFPCPVLLNSFGPSHLFEDAGVLSLHVQYPVPCFCGASRIALGQSNITDILVELERGFLHGLPPLFEGLFDRAAVLEPKLRLGETLPTAVILGI